MIWYVRGGRQKKNFHVKISICGCDNEPSHPDRVADVYVYGLLECDLKCLILYLSAVILSYLISIAFINSKQNSWFQDKCDILRWHNGQTFANTTWTATLTIKQMKRNETKRNVVEYAIN